MNIRHIEMTAHPGGLTRLTAVVDGDRESIAEVVNKANNDPDKKPWTLQIQKVKKKRSLDANSYYWVLLSKLSKVIGASMPYCHNLMLCRYGQPMLVDERLVYVLIPNSDEAESKVEEDETVHLKPTSQTRVGKDGKSYRTYFLMRGSSSYDTTEFKALLDGLIRECKECKIDTMTPDELKRLEGYGV